MGLQHGRGGERGRKKALDVLAEIEDLYAAAREGEEQAFAQAMLAETSAVLALTGQRPWIGAGDGVTEVYRMTGAALVVRLMQAMRASVEQQAQITGVMRALGGKGQ